MQLIDCRASNGLSAGACLITTPNLLFFLARLNSIRRLEADEIDFLHHVTQLDLRDNKLGELDATVFNNVEVLHCERNQLVTLKISGYFLKALYASCNGKRIFRAAVALSYLVLCEMLVECSARNQEAVDAVLDKRVSHVLLAVLSFRSDFQITQFGGLRIAKTLEILLSISREGSGICQLFQLH